MTLLRQTGYTFSRILTLLNSHTCKLPIRMTRKLCEIVVFLQRILVTSSILIPPLPLTLHRQFDCIVCLNLMGCFNMKSPNKSKQSNMKIKPWVDIKRNLYCLQNWENTGVTSNPCSSWQWKSRGYAFINKSSKNFKTILS